MLTQKIVELFKVDSTNLKSIKKLINNYIRIRLDSKSTQSNSINKIIKLDYVRDWLESGIVMQGWDRDG